MPDLRTRKYGLLFGVQRSVRYHARRRRHFDRLQRIINTVTLAAGSGAFLAWMTDAGWPIGALSALVAILAIVEFVIGCGICARNHHDMEKRWISLEQEIVAGGEYDEAHYIEFKNKRLGIEADERPALRVLDVLCHNELLRAEGREGQGDDWEVGPIQRLFASWFDWRPDSIKRIKS